MGGREGVVVVVVVVLGGWVRVGQADWFCH